MIEEGRVPSHDDAAATTFVKLITGVSPVVAQRGHDNATKKGQKPRIPRGRRQKITAEVASTNQAAWRTALFLAGCSDMSSKEQVGHAARRIAIERTPDGSIHPVVCNNPEQKIKLQAIYDAK